MILMFEIYMKFTKIAKTNEIESINFELTTLLPMPLENF